jgi:hypothetical protein
LHKTKFQKAPPILVPKYYEVSDHFGLSSNPEDIESMNIIYDVCQKEPNALLVATEFNSIIIKRIILDDDFTRIRR